MLLESYLPRFENPEYTLRHLRKDLEKEGRSDEQISRIIREVDNILLEEVHQSKATTPPFLFKTVGIVVFLFGAMLCLNSTGFFGISYFFYYGPMAIGTALYIKGVRRKRFREKRIKFNHRVRRGVF